MNQAEEMAMQSIAFMADQIKITWQQTAYVYEQPHVVYKVRVFPDGDMWCALYGGNIQEGVCGFGVTPAKACYDFDKNWTSQGAQQPRVAGGTNAP
jgi:hypothetical protein